MNKAVLSLFAIALSVAANAQSSVTTGGQKYVVLEEATGAWCGYCPDGALRLEQITAANPRAIGVSIHDGDGMEMSDGTTFNTDYVSSWPSGSIDRIIGSGQTAVAINRGYWASVVSSRLAVAPQADVTMTHTYQSSTRTLTITLSGKTLSALTGSYNTNVYVVEDSVSGSGSQYDQHNYYSSQNSSPAGGTTHYYYSFPAVITGFQHMQVVRAMLGGTYGSTGVIANNPANNVAFTKTYTYVVPASYNVNHLKLVGLVQKFNSADKNDRAILNARSAKVVNYPTAVTQLATLDELNVYPNPANAQIQLSGTWVRSADVRVSLQNALGQTLYTQELHGNANQPLSQSIPVADISNGLYYLHIEGDGMKIVKAVSVNH